MDGKVDHLASRIDRIRGRRAINVVGSIELSEESWEDFAPCPIVGWVELRNNGDLGFDIDRGEGGGGIALWLEWKGCGDSGCEDSTRITRNSNNIVVDIVGHGKEWRMVVQWQRKDFLLLSLHDYLSFSWYLEKRER